MYKYPYFDASEIFFSTISKLPRNGINPTKPHTPINNSSSLAILLKEIGVEYVGN